MEREYGASGLENHWTKPIGPAGYYWFLTFEDSAPLHSLAAEAQSSIDLPWYDPVPREGLHLTLERIARPGEVTAEQLCAAENRARQALRDIDVFDMNIGHLRRVPSAIIFDVAPAVRIGELQSSLRTATANAANGLPVQPPRPPAHITLAYCRSDGPVPRELDDAMAAADRDSRIVRTTVVEVVMVLLERGRSSYSWESLARVPLAGHE